MSTDLIIRRNLLKCVSFNVTFCCTGGKLAVYSLKGLHSSQAALLSNVVGGALKGLTLLYRMGVGRLKPTQREKKNMSLSLERLDQGNMKIITLTIITANIYCLGTMWQALYCLPFRSNLFTLHHRTLRSALLLWTFALEQQASGG